MKNLVIYNSVKYNWQTFIFCLVLMAIPGLVLLLAEIQGLAIKLVLIIGMGIFGAIAAYYNHRRKDKRPLYIIDNKGIYARDEEHMVSWTDLSYFETYVKASRANTCREIRCFNAAGIILVTIDLLNSTNSVESVEKVLLKKITQHPPDNFK